MPTETPALKRRPAGARDALYGGKYHIPTKSQNSEWQSHPEASIRESEACRETLSKFPASVKSRIWPRGALKIGNLEIYQFATHGRLPSEFTQTPAISSIIARLITGRDSSIPLTRERCEEGASFSLYGAGGRTRTGRKWNCSIFRYRRKFGWRGEEVRPASPPCYPILRKCISRKSLGVVHIGVQGES